MSIQIAVRLPDELAAFIDEEVAAGRAASRAAVITSAVERELRRSLALADIEILKASTPNPDLHDLAEHASQQPLDLD